MGHSDLAERTPSTNIGRGLINTLALTAGLAAAARSLAGHIVAGVASQEEVEAFRKFCEGLPGAPGDQ